MFKQVEENITISTRRHVSLLTNTIFGMHSTDNLDDGYVGSRKEIVVFNTKTWERKSSRRNIRALF